MKLDETMREQNEWPQAGQFKRSIRMEFSLYVSAMILLLMAVTGYVITDKYVTSTTRNVVEKLLIQARSYSGPAGKHIISANGPDALMLNNICKKLAGDDSDVYWVGVTNKDRVFLAHTDIKQVISGNAMAIPKSRAFDQIIRADESFEVVNDTLVLTVPVKENDILLGYLGIASSNRQITQARRASILSVATITIIMILLGVPITILVLSQKLRPISIITGHLKRIDYGDIALNIPVTARNEFGYLAETLRVMGTKLNDAQHERIEKERISREFEIARELQEKILPRSFPKSDKYEFAGFYSSAKEVGGDYYDFIDISENFVGYVVADVSGKSLPGMLVMLLTRDIVKHLAPRISDPAELLTEVNNELIGNIKRGMFVTMFYGVLNKETGIFAFASAGHNPLIHISARNNHAYLLKTHGFPLGMMPSDQFSGRIETGEIRLGADDWLIQYTDGINEAQSVDKEEYGMERFVAEIQSLGDSEPEILVDELMKRHRQFVGEAEQYDDITLVAMKWRGRMIPSEYYQEEVAVSGN